MHSSAFTTCESQSAYNTSWLFWHTWSYMEARHLTLVHVTTLLISVIDECSILLALTISLCHQPTVTEALVLCPLLADRGHITRVHPYPVAHRQNETEMFSDHDETSPSIAAVSVKLPTVGSRAFPVSTAQLWNSLPDDIVLADSLSTFRCQLKHYLFQQSYPDVVL